MSFANQSDQRCMLLSLVRCSGGYPISPKKRFFFAVNLSDQKCFSMAADSIPMRRSAHSIVFFPRNWPPICSWHPFVISTNPLCLCGCPGKIRYLFRAPGVSLYGLIIPRGFAHWDSAGHLPLAIRANSQIGMGCVDCSVNTQYTVKMTLKVHKIWGLISFIQIYVCQPLGLY